MKSLARIFTTLTAMLRNNGATLTWRKQCWPCVGRCNTHEKDSCYAIWVGQDRGVIVAVVDCADHGELPYSWYCYGQSGYAETLALAQDFAQNALPEQSPWWRSARRSPRPSEPYAFSPRESDLPESWTRSASEDCKQVK